MNVTTCNFKNITTNATFKRIEALAPCSGNSTINGTGDNANNTVRMANTCDLETSTGNIVYTIFLLIVLIIGFSGNTLVCLTIIKYRQLRKQITNYFIVSLAVSDIAVSVISLPFRIYTSLHNQSFCAGLHFCGFYVIMDSTSCAASITNLLIIALDRYFLISLPYVYPTLMSRRRAIALCICIWIYSHLWSWSSVFTWTTPPEVSISVSNNRCTNTNSKYVITSISLLYLLPLVIMGIVYAIILRIASKQAKNIASYEVTLKGQKRRARERKATNTLAIIYGAFVVCWLPNFLLSLSVTLCPKCFLQLQKDHYWLFMMLLIIFVQVLPVLNSAINPFIYGIHNKQFRSAFRQMVFKKRSSKFYDSENGLTQMSEFRRTKKRSPTATQDDDNNLITNGTSF
eukprot:gene19230-21157_t